MNWKAMTAGLLSAAMVMSMTGCSKEDKTEAEAPAAAAGVAVQVETVQRDTIATEN